MNERKLVIEEIASGARSGYSEYKESVQVARDQKSFERIYQFTQSNKPMPIVDFSRDAVVGYFAGIKRSSGYTARVKEAFEISGEIGIRPEVTEPPAGAIVTQALTSPYVLVKLKDVWKPFGQDVNITTKKVK